MHSTPPGGSQSPEGQTGAETYERGGLRTASSRSGRRLSLGRMAILRPVTASDPAGHSGRGPARETVPGPRAGRRADIHTTQGSISLATEIGIRELLEAGVHFGHQTRRWNPKMRRFIFGERGGIHIIDLQKTERLLHNGAGVRRRPRRPRRHRSCSWARRSRPATRSRRPPTSCGMPYIDQRWLGGLLTNFQTITKRIRRLHELRDWTESRHDGPAAGARAHRRDERARQARDEPRRRGRHAAPARRDVRGGPQDRGDRRARGQRASRSRSSGSWTPTATRTRWTS